MSDLKFTRACVITVCFFPTQNIAYCRKWRLVKLDYEFQLYS